MDVDANGDGWHRFLDASQRKANIACSLHVILSAIIGCFNGQPVNQYRTHNYGASYFMGGPFYMCSANDSAMLQVQPTQQPL